MAKARGLIAEIKAHIPQSKALRWYERVTAQHTSTLDEIKRAFHAGEFGSGKKPACRAISKYLNDNGISKVGYHGVLNWLENAE